MKIHQPDGFGDQPLLRCKPLIWIRVHLVQELNRLVTVVPISAGEAIGVELLLGNESRLSDDNSSLSFNDVVSGIVGISWPAEPVIRNPVAHGVDMHPPLA